MTFGITAGLDPRLPSLGVAPADPVDDDHRLVGGVIQIDQGVGIGAVSAIKLEQLSELATLLVLGATPGWCGTLGLISINGDDITIPAVAVYINPASATVQCEVLRIDNHLIDGDSLRFEIRDKFIRGLEPFIEGVGQIWVV